MLMKTFLLGVVTRMVTDPMEREVVKEAISDVVVLLRPSEHLDLEVAQARGRMVRLALNSGGKDGYAV